MTAPRLITLTLSWPAEIVTSLTSLPSGIVPNFASAIAAPPLESDRLVVSADRLVGAEHAVDHCEHLAHALLGHRTLDDDDELRLVRRGTDEAPGAVVGDDADAVDRDEIGDRVAAGLLALFLHAFEGVDHLVGHGILDFVVAMGRHGRRAPGLGQRILEVGHRLAGVAVEHVEDGDGRQDAVVITAAEGWIEEVMAGLLEAGNGLQ